MSLIEKLSNLSSIGGELRGFLSAPTLAGFTSLMSSSSATGGAIAALGSAAAVAVPILGGVILAAGGVSLAMQKMQQSVEIVSQRISELTRFSGALMMSSAQERLAQFSRSLQDAQVNGAKYAEAQRYQTLAENARAAMMVEFNKLLGESAVLWSRFMVTVYRLLYPLGWIAGKLGELISSMRVGTDAAFVSLQGYVAGAFKEITEPFAAYLDRLTGNTGFFLWVKDAISSILKWLGLIATNTKPATTGGVNNWFLADVMAMTGRKY